jgi:hypothetical protein
MISIPEIIFNQDREIEETRGIRIFINGIGFLYLGLFVCINKFVETKRFFWIFISGGLFIIIIFHLTRQAILFSFIIALYYLLRNSKQLWFYLSFMTVLLYGSNMTFNKDSALVPLIEYTEKQIEAQQSGDEYVRISDYRYYFTEYSKNIITNIFGNGAPHKESAFGKREKQLQTSKSLYVSDVGYAQLFVWYGGLVLLLYLILFYRVVKQKVPAKYMYTKLFLIYVLFTGITSDSILKFTIEISMCLFILEYYNLKEKNEIKHSHNNIEL